MTACTVVDSRLLVPGSGGDGSGGDGSGGNDVPCSPTDEVCNGVDDDCDGVIDGPLADADCERRLPGAITSCSAGLCVPQGCLPGFASCDGVPDNGCEPECECRPCDDADAGADMDAGTELADGGTGEP